MMPIAPFVAGEVRKLKLRAACGFLNCCNSGRGEVNERGTLNGLASAFMSVGVGAMVVCLWTVLDTTSGDIADAFYDQLAKATGTTTSRALQAAILGSMRTGAAAREWSAFVLHGPSSEAKFLLSLEKNSIPSTAKL